jgi:hypothetical protein
VAPNSRHGIIDGRRNHRKVKDLIGLVSQFVPLVGTFVPAIRAFKFASALWNSGFSGRKKSDAPPSLIIERVNTRLQLSHCRVHRGISAPIQPYRPEKRFPYTRYLKVPEYAIAQTIRFPQNYSLPTTVRRRTLRPIIPPEARFAGIGAMNYQTYAWQHAYMAPVCETDNGLMMIRIYEALAAIQQRRLSPIEPDGDEDRALKNADAGIKALIAERTDSDS